MAWNLMQAELIEADRLIKPLIGVGGLTRADALAQVQAILDRAAGLNAEMARAAQLWRRGAADDTLLVGPFVWAIYEHPDGEDPVVAAHAWAEEFAAALRRTGVDVAVARFPG